MPVAYTHMLADPDGTSRFEDAGIEFVERGPTRPIAALLSERFDARTLRFLEFPPGLSVTHTAPGRQFFIVLEGEIEVTTSAGGSRRFRPGEMGLANDLSGDGHRTETMGGIPARLAIVELAEGAKLG